MDNELNYEDLLSTEGEKPVDSGMGSADRLNAEVKAGTLKDDDDPYIGAVKEFNYGDNFNTEPVKNDGDSDDVLYDFLREHGIEDPSKMKFSNDNDEIEDVDFRSLSKDEQMEILKNLTDSGLSTQEKADLNYLRQNGLNLKSYGSAISQQSVQNYLAQHPEGQPERVYGIDDYTDDELYLADLKSKYPEFTDEELLSKLDSAKDNEDLYIKEVTALRNSYKEDEDNMIRQQQEAEKQQYVDLQNNLMAATRDFTEVLLDPDDPESDSLMVEDADKKQILSYLLDQDSQGKSQLVRDLEDPNVLVQLAWLRLQGQNAIADTSRYWKETLKETRKENAKLQKEIDKLKGNKGNNTVIVPSKKSSNDKNISSIWDKLI